jgi:cytochrome o ubiquinol oxidase subunit 2
MNFKMLGLDQAGFDRWIAGVRGSSLKLTDANYLKLEKPSEDVKPIAFSGFAPGLYGRILNRCTHPGETCIADVMMQDMAKGSKAPVNDTTVAPGRNPKGAVFKSPEEEGTSPHSSQSPAPGTPGNAAPGNQQNRGVS